MQNTFSIADAIKYAWREFKSNWKFWFIVIFLVAGTSMTIGKSADKTEREVQKAGTNQVFNFKSPTNVLGTTDDRTNLVLPAEPNYPIGTDTTNPTVSTRNRQVSPLVPGTPNLAPLIVLLLPFFLIFLVLCFIGLILIAATSIIMEMGHVHVLLEVIRTGKHDYKTLLSDVSVKKALKLLALSILYLLMVLIGTVFFIIPGIYLAITYVYAPFIFVDKNTTIGDAFSQSAKITSKNKLKLFGFSFVCVLIAILGLLVFIVGIIPAGIVVGIAHAYVYNELSKEPVTVAEVAPVGTLA